MCSTVNHRGRTYETPRALGSLIGTLEELVWRDRKDELDWCLCVIDVPLSLNRARLRWKQAEASNTFIIED
ncbi:hypothetical protein [Sinorhizobium americanum]|nr:hypothetical protein [Sinorhizobium americanum]